MLVAGAGLREPLLAQRAREAQSLACMNLHVAPVALHVGKQLRTDPACEHL